MRIAIRDTTTGEVREGDAYTGPGFDPTDPEDVAGMEWYWTEGNYGCDCNRWLFFERAADGDPDIDDAECGEGRFEIVRALWLP